MPISHLLAHGNTVQLFIFTSSKFRQFRLLEMLQIIQIGNSEYFIFVTHSYLICYPFAITISYVFLKMGGAE